MERPTQAVPRSGDEEGSPVRRRLLVYAVSIVNGRLDDYVPLALAAAGPACAATVVVVFGDLTAEDAAVLHSFGEVVTSARERFTPTEYARVLRDCVPDVRHYDDVVLSGDSWFGPTAPFAPILDRMDAAGRDVWEIVESAVEPTPAFPDEGFPDVPEPWLWVSVATRVVTSEVWNRFWRSARADSRSSDFVSFVRAAGISTGSAFVSSDYRVADAATLVPDLLVRDGCPLVARRTFGLYPPYLHQQAVVGREIVGAMADAGYPVEAAWQHLSRTVPSKALNTNAGMLEVIAEPPRFVEWAPRVVAVAHINDLDHAPSLIRRLGSLPPGFDLVVTTSDGKKAVALTRLTQKAEGLGAGHVDIRVTPSNRGRDMSDFFIACRDVLAPGRYDLVVKVHSRPIRRKTLNVRRYFRRYQLDNLLAGPGHVAGILELFAREPGLGLVFPPMMHIGYATMGRAWGDYRESALDVLGELGVAVPLDKISPLAPFGGMWFARPEALRLLSEHPWAYRDYAKPGRKRFRDLARLQERIVVPAAAELGYHSRTVLTPEHAAISHTALEFKADQLFSTTRGYPIDSIRLLHRAGPTGYGGLVGLSRMYLRLNHRVLGRLLLPLLDAAQWFYTSVRAALGDERFIRPRETWRDEDL